jgi:GrpB-like predicted nucleotidyltransferase (UPF0157 family)
VKPRAPHRVEDEPVRIHPYDPDWPARFEQERADLERVLGTSITGGIHHDIEPLATLGYMYAPYRTEEMAWFCKPNPGHRTHHLHLVPTGSRRFRDELAFRDYLRAHREVACEYARLKRHLARQFESDRETYTEAKR